MSKTQVIIASLVCAAAELAAVPDVEHAVERGARTGLGALHAAALRSRAGTVVAHPSVIPTA